MRNIVSIGNGGRPPSASARRFHDAPAALGVARATATRRGREIVVYF
jgi:hypothetical protein